MQCLLKRILNIVLEWKIPYFSFLQKYLWYLALGAFSIFLIPWEFKEFWKYAFSGLIFILFLSPLSKIFPRIKILTKLMVLRKQFWIIVWALVFAHFVWFMQVNNIQIPQLISENINPLENYTNFKFWWILWVIAMLFPFLTSNNFSIKLLKKKWKYLQYFSYLFFIFTILHLYFRKWEIEEFLPLIIWIILKILVWRKVVIWK